MSRHHTVLEKLWALRCELIKEYGEDHPIQEIRLERKTYNMLMSDVMMSDKYSKGLDLAGLAEPEIFDITVLPEKR